MADSFETATPPITGFGPDFPFDYERWLAHPDGLGTLPESAHGTRIAVIGGGMSGLVAAYELLRLGLHPVIYEANRLGGRLRSEPFAADPSVIAEMGGMRFPDSSTAFGHYVDALGLERRPFPNPLTPQAGSTVIDLGGETLYAESLGDLPPLYAEVAAAWDTALEEELGFSGLQDAIRERNADRLKELWNEIVPRWDDHSFYEFVVESKAFSTLSFRHREVFGQVGFGTGGWDSDFANTMLEILRVVVTNCDSDQQLIVGGAEQVPRGLWTRPVGEGGPWPARTTLESVNDGAPRGAVRALRRADEGRIRVIAADGTEEEFASVVVTCQSWLLTTSIDTEESLFSQDLWMALDRTRYMQSSKTFVMVDRPFWNDVDPATGRHPMSMTLTDRLTRGTYLFDNGPDAPAAICLTYSWMSDALKMLPYSAAERAELAIGALEKIYPDLDLRSHLVGEPLTVSWELEPYSLGAFKGALPGHYRYNERMYSHFMQDELDPSERGIYLAGDDISFTPAWVEGAVQTALNVVWGVMHQFGGSTPAANPGPGDEYPRLRPIRLPE